MPNASKDKLKSGRKSTERLSQHVLYGLVGCAAVTFVAFFLFGYDTPYWKNESMNAPLLTDGLMGLVYAMAVATSVLALLSGLHSARLHQGTASIINNVPARKISIAVSALTLALLLGSFLLADTGPMAVNGETYSNWWGLKIAGTLISTAAVLLVAAIVAALFGATRYNRKENKKD